MTTIRILLSAVLVLLLAGCQKPTEVQVTDETAVEIEEVTETDPTANRVAVDSTALLPKDQERFPGLIALTSVRSDYGQGTVETIVYARVALENRALWFTDPFGRKRFFGNLLGVVRINGELMFPIPRIVQNDTAGYEYVRGNVPFTPRGQYRFTATGSVGNGNVGGFDVSVNAPDNLVIQSPTGGTQVRQGNDLEIRWKTQSNNIGLIVGAVRVVNGQPRSVPIFTIRPKHNTGRAILDKKILDALPRGEYVFTFVAANRSEHVFPRYPGRVLAQATSIHNVLVKLI